MNFGPNKKVRNHAKDTLNSITKLNTDAMLQRHYTDRGSNKQKILLALFQNWNKDLARA